MAIADYTAAIQIMPDLAEPFFNRELAYRKKKQYDNALSDFNEALRLLPGRSKYAEEKTKPLNH
ncbi:MAG: hypothetical protein Pg6C_12630 [Treponemataceae bacterium]|nr:MAG: hypothetical protein Pg6C_12630 [Treponemataceae bacterium]